MTKTRPKHSNTKQDQARQDSNQEAYKNADVVATLVAILKNITVNEIMKISLVMTSQRHQYG